MVALAVNTSSKVHKLCEDGVVVSPRECEAEH